jgi:hypothetical protein
MLRRASASYEDLVDKSPWTVQVKLSRTKSKETAPVSPESCSTDVSGGSSSPDVDLAPSCLGGVQDKATCFARERVNEKAQTRHKAGETRLKNHDPSQGHHGMRRVSRSIRNIARIIVLGSLYATAFFLRYLGIALEAVLAAIEGYRREDAACTHAHAKADTMNPKHDFGLPRKWREAVVGFFLKDKRPVVSVNDGYCEAHVASTTQLKQKPWVGLLHMFVNINGRFKYDEFLLMFIIGVLALLPLLLAWPVLKELVEKESLLHAIAMASEASLSKYQFPFLRDFFQIQTFINMLIDRYSRRFRKHCKGVMPVTSQARKFVPS